MEMYFKSTSLKEKMNYDLFLLIIDFAKQNQDVQTDMKNSVLSTQLKE